MHFGLGYALRGFCIGYLYVSVTFHYLFYLNFIFLVFQSSEDLFQFMPNMTQQELDNCSTSDSGIRGKDVVGCVRHPKRQNKHVFYTIIKKPNNTNKKPYKVVKI